MYEEKSPKLLLYHIFIFKCHRVCSKIEKLYIKMCIKKIWEILLQVMAKIVEREYEMLRNRNNYSRRYVLANRGSVGENCRAVNVKRKPSFGSRITREAASTIKLQFRGGSSRFRENDRRRRSRRRVSRLPPRQQQFATWFVRTSSVSRRFFRSSLIKRLLYRRSKVRQ